MSRIIDQGAEAKTTRHKCGCLDVRYKGGGVRSTLCAGHEASRGYRQMQASFDGMRAVLERLVAVTELSVRRRDHYSPNLLKRIKRFFFGGYYIQ